jgi:hypothetical protein
MMQIGLSCGHLPSPTGTRLHLLPSMKYHLIVKNDGYEL